MPKPFKQKELTALLAKVLPVYTATDACCLNSEFKQCCCNCQHHHADYYHCTTAPAKRKEMGTCICGIVKGWICIPPEFDGRAFSGWDKHSIGCEMYTKQ